MRLTDGATSTHKQVIVLHVLAPVTEPTMLLQLQVWAAWRREMCALARSLSRAPMT